MKTWGEMSDAEKGELLLAHHNGEVIEFYSKGNSDCYGGVWNQTYGARPLWDIDTQYRVKKKPVVTEHSGESWAFHDEGEEPSTSMYRLDEHCVHGVWTVKHVDGKLQSFTWEAYE